MLSEIMIFDFVWCITFYIKSPYLTPMKEVSLLYWTLCVRLLFAKSASYFYEALFCPTTARSDFADSCCICRTVLEWSCTAQRTPLRSLWMAFSVWVSAKKQMSGSNEPQNKGKWCDFISKGKPVHCIPVMMNLLQ